MKVVSDEKYGRLPVNQVPAVRLERVTDEQSRESCKSGESLLDYLLELFVEIDC